LVGAVPAPDAPEERSVNEDLRFPIGRLAMKPDIDPATRTRLIDDIAAMPAALAAAVGGLSAAQLDTPYRDGGWTVRQVVHHLADSHVNAYIRMRLAVTEDNPTLKPYDEEEWAKLDDARTGDIALSMPLIDALHRRWVVFMRGLPAEAFARPIVHPASGQLTVDKLLQIYGWHSRHHVAHVAALRVREGW
jgi:hypothetical protein